MKTEYRSVDGGAIVKTHPSITMDRVSEAVESQFTSLANPGFCIACGADADNCEPDAREYRCESCRQRTVSGESSQCGAWSQRLKIASRV